MKVIFLKSLKIETRSAKGKYSNKNWWKMTKFKNSNATFCVTFKQCAFLEWLQKISFGCDEGLENKSKDNTKATSRDNHRL